MNPVLIYLRPLDKGNNQRVDVRAADGGSADDFAVAGYAWDPAVAVRPTMSIELMSMDMSGQVQAGEARFEILLRNLSHPRPLDLYWKGASVVIHSAGILEGATSIPDFWGYITSATPNIETGRLAITAQVSTALIDKPLLFSEFTGGGGAGGEPEKRGVLYPAGFGKVNNIEPVWFDTVRNIGMIDGYGNTVSIDWLGEGRSSFGTKVANYASYAALAAAVDAKAIPPGRWATSIAAGQPSYVALGAPPVGIITVDATFGSNRLGAMMKRMLLTHAKVPAARVHSASFDLLDAQVPRAVHFYTAEQRTVRELLEALAQSANATPLVSFQNQVMVTRAVASTPVLTLDRSGGVDPRVLDWQQADVDPPYSRLRARTNRPARVLSIDQVNYVDTLVDKGMYDAEVVYRAGNLVYLTDGSQWLYINPVPGAGMTPPAGQAPDANGDVSDSYWFRRQPPRPDIKFEYEDGTPFEALKPAIKGATKNRIRGDWVSGTAYEIGDVVLRNGSSYDAIIDHTSTTSNGPPGVNWVLHAKAGIDGINAPLLKTQWSIDGVSNWHDNYFGGDIFYRTSNNNGATYGPAIRGVGENGARGVDGGYEDSVFVYSSTLPAAPVGADHPGWYDSPTPTEFLGINFSARDHYPTGNQWLRVQPGEVYRVTGYANATSAKARGSVGLFFASNIADGNTFSWIPAGGADPGAIAYVDGYIVVPAGKTFMRPWAQIDKGNDFGTFGYNFKLENLPPLFMSRVKRNADDSLAEAWSAPARITGEDRGEALVAILTNENFSHPTDPAGNPTAVTTVGNGQMKVYLGSREITALCTFTKQEPFWLGVTIDASGNYSANYLGNDTGYAYLIATFQGRAVAKTLTATRAKAGAKPPLIVLSASDQSFTLDTNGAVRAKTIRLTATPQNNTAAVLWAVFNQNGTPIITGAATADAFVAAGAVSRAINALTVEIDSDKFQAILAAQGGESLTYGVQFNGETGSDRVSIVRLRDGARGAPGADGLPVVKGADGQTYYQYVAFANSADGSIDFTTGEPGTRSFIGVGNGTAATEPNSPIYYAWTPYRGPPFGLTGYQVSIAGSQIIMTASGGWGTSGAYSAVGYRSGAATSFRAGDSHVAGGSNIMAGLNTDPTTDNSFASIDYAWFMSDSGDAQVYENGVAVGGVISGFGAGTFQVVYDNKVVRYLYNGVVQRTVSAPADLVLFFDAALAGGPGTSRLQDVTFTAGGRAGDNGAPGANGTSPLLLELSTDAIIIAATDANVTKPWQLPRNVGVSLKQGTTDAIGAYTFVVTTSEKVSATYSNAVLQITRADGEGWAEITAYNGSAAVAGPKRVSIGRTLDPPPPQTATSVTVLGYNGDPNSTSYLAQPSGKIATVQVGSNGVLPYKMYATYSVAANQSFASRTYAAAGKIVYRVAGSGAAWSDLISEKTGTLATWYRSTEEYENGDIYSEGTVNLTPGQAYDFALMIRKHSGTSTTQGVEGYLRMGA